MTHSHRPNADLSKLCHINQGLYSAPSINKAEWDTVVTCDKFMYPHKRNMAIEEAIDLISSDDCDCE